VLTVIDARRGEAFVAGWAAGVQLVAPAAVAPEVLAALAPPPGGRAWLAVGDGAIRFREALTHAGAEVPEDGDPGHRIAAGATARLGLRGTAGQPDDVAPMYLRQPDAIPRTAP
jgi:tRNA threonylcarbamoyladenosine biosynthesis protein TsaB